MMREDDPNYDPDYACRCAGCTADLASVEKAREQLLQAGIADDPANPPHYDGDACMVAIEALGWGREFCLGSALKYIWRSGRKGDELDDLKKARWYLSRVIEKAVP